MKITEKETVFGPALKKSFFLVAMLLGGVRGKKKKTGGSTRNQCGFPPGKKRGLKIYDGQRVPIGKVLVDQVLAWVLPGWNVSALSAALLSIFSYFLMIRGARKKVLLKKSPESPSNLRPNLTTLSRSKFSSHYVGGELSGPL